MKDISINVKREGSDTIQESDIIQTFVISEASAGEMYVYNCHTYKYDSNHIPLGNKC